MAERMPSVSGAADPIGKPRDWDKCVAAAYLRAIGKSQAAAAEGAGVSERSVLEWEKCSWWPDAQAEAHDRWLNNVTAKARGALLEGLTESKPELALSVLERIEKRLSPAKQRHEHVGLIGLVKVLSSMAPDEIERLESMSDDEIRQEVGRLARGG